MKKTKKLLSISLAFITIFLYLTCMTPKITVHAADTIGPPPSTYLTSIIPGTNNISIYWKPISSCNRYEIQYSTDPGFSTNTKMITVTGASQASYTFNNTLLPDTAYYFRIRTVSDKLLLKNSDWSAAKKFSYTLPATSLTSLTLNDSEVMLSWNRPSPIITGYEIEYSTSPQFSNVLKRFRISSAAQTTLSLENAMTPELKYYFRIRTIKIADGQTFYSVWSSPKNIIYNLKAPTNTRVDIFDDHFVVLWNKLNKVDHLIQISDNATFDNILLETKTTNTAYTINKGLVADKTYYVRVCAYLRGHTSPWSETYAFKYVMKPAVIKQATVKDMSLSLSWSYQSKATGYMIEYSPWKTFDKNVTSIAVGSVNTYTINNLRPGTYYIRIKALNNISSIENNTYTNKSPWSGIASFTVLPKQTSIYSMSISDQRIALKWNAVAPCSGYEIQYSTTESFSNGKTIKVNGGSNGYFEFKNDLIPGTKYYIRVRSFDSSTSAMVYSKWSYPKTFSYQLRSTYIKTLSVVNNNVKVNWQSYDVYSGYEIQYGTDPSFAKSKILNFAEWETSGGMISGLEPGVQHFRIRGYKVINGNKYYSAWSNVKTISCKLSKTYIRNMYVTDNGIKVDWLISDGCTGYELQYATNGNMTNSKTMQIAGATISTAFLKNNIAPGTVFVRIRAFKTVNGMNFYSEWSNIKSIAYKLNKTYLTNLYIANNTATVCWKPIVGCDGYQLQYSQSPSLSNAKTIQIAGEGMNKYGGIILAPGTNYLRIRTYKIVDGTYHYSDWSNVKTITYQIPKTTLKYVVAQYNKIQVSWVSNSKVSGYELQYSTSQSFTSNIKTIDITVNNVNGCTLSPTPAIYHFRIRTYQIINGQKYYSDWSNQLSADFKIGGTELTSAYNDGAYTRFTWSISKGCHGYQIQTSPYKTFDKNVKTIYVGNTNTDKYAIKEGPSSAITYVRIRAYKIIDGQKYYSNWSTIQIIQYK